MKEAFNISTLVYHFCKKMMRACYFLIKRKLLKILAINCLSLLNQVYLYFSEHFFKIYVRIQDLGILNILSSLINNPYHFRDCKLNSIVILLIEDFLAFRPNSIELVLGNYLFQITIKNIFLFFIKNRLRERRILYFRDIKEFIKINSL